MLSSVRVLEEEYGVSRVTVQRIFDRLREDGFLETRVGHGTRVVDYPPHRFRYGLVLPAAPGTYQWTRYYESLKRAAPEVMQGEAGRRAVFYEGVNQPSLSAPYESLEYDVLHQRCAGLLFPMPPAALAHSPVLDHPGLPRVVAGMPTPWLGCSTIHLDSELFLQTALSRLRDHGCRRVGMVVAAAPGLAEPQVWNRLQQWAGSFGLQTRREWVQGGDVHTPAWTVNMTRLLLAAPPDERP
jgi:DNA-binding LacI/PurR family transcriptional regulator